MIEIKEYLISRSKPHKSAFKDLTELTKDSILSWLDSNDFEMLENDKYDIAQEKYDTDEKFYLMGPWEEKDVYTHWISVHCKGMHELEFRFEKDDTLSVCRYKKKNSPGRIKHLHRDDKKEIIELMNGMI